MDNKLPMDDQKKALRGKFHGHQKLKSQYIPLYPDSSEREMRRISNAYMKIVSDELKAILPEIINAYDMEIRNDSRADSLWDLDKKISDGFSKAAERIGKRAKKLNLGALLSKTASGVKKTAVLEWKRMIGKTFGINVDAEYYKDEMFSDALNEWREQLGGTFNEVPIDICKLVQKKIEDGFRDGVPTSEIKKEIQHIYSVARQEAADNVAGSVSLLNYKVSRRIQEDAGVDEYMWFTRRDSVVRPCHASFHGKIYRWDQPPEIWYETKARGRVWTGRCCHPGEDYNCRCRAVPVFKRENLSIPVEKQ